MVVFLTVCFGGCQKLRLLKLACRAGVGMRLELGVPSKVQSGQIPMRLFKKIIQIYW